MPVLEFVTDRDVKRFAKAFLDNRFVTFKKDIAICLTAGPTKTKQKSHAYFPALITCIAFADLLSGLYAGKLKGHGLKELKDYTSKFMDPTVYTPDRLDVLYECFRHKVAHLAQPYAVFDTNPAKNKTFSGQPRRLITWTVNASGPRPPIRIVPVNPRKQILKAVTPWEVLYDYRAIVNVRGLASDIVRSIPKYLRHLKTDSVARSHFRACMEICFPKP